MGMPIETIMPDDERPIVMATRIVDGVVGGIMRSRLCGSADTMGALTNTLGSLVGRFALSEADIEPLMRTLFQTALAIAQETRNAVTPPALGRTQQETAEWNSMT